MVVLRGSFAEDECPGARAGSQQRCAGAITCATVRVPIVLQCPRGRRFPAIPRRRLSGWMYEACPVWFESDTSTARLMGWILRKRIRRRYRAGRRERRAPGGADPPAVVILNGSRSADEASELIERMRERAPETHFVEVVKASHRRGRLPDGATALYAPFDADTLIRVVHEAECGEEMSGVLGAIGVAAPAPTMLHADLHPPGYSLFPCVRRPVGSTCGRMRMLESAHIFGLNVSGFELFVAAHNQIYLLLVLAMRSSRGGRRGRSNCRTC